MVSITGGERGRGRGGGGSHMFYSCTCDHLRPRCVVSACDLLALGNDLEGRCFFVTYCTALGIFYAITQM